MPDVVLGVLVIAGFAGWMLTLGMLTRSMVPMANALAVCQKIVDREDEKVFSLAKRAVEKQNRGVAPAPPKPPPESAQTNPMAEIFGNGGMTLIDEQPGAREDLEVIG